MNTCKERNVVAMMVAVLMAGVLLVIVGVLLSLPGVPGQGLLTVLAGVILIEFPGRHRLVRAIIGRPAVLCTPSPRR